MFDDSNMICILGCGTMGDCFLSRLSTKFLSSQLIGTVSSQQSLAKLKTKYPNIIFTTNNKEAIMQCQIIIICLKPQNVFSVLQEFKEDLENKLVISVAAGVSLHSLERSFPNTLVVRCMTNTPSLVGEGMTVLSCNSQIRLQYHDLLDKIFSLLGSVEFLDEKHLDVVTALSGSGPAFFCVIAEALADGGVMLGLPKSVALKLVTQTMKGTAKLILESGDHPSALKDKVTTPGGCTIAGLLAMEDGNIRSVLAKSVQASALAASNLGKSPK